MSMLIVSITTLSAQDGEPYFIESWTDSISTVLDGKEYTIQYLIKKYDVGRYVTLGDEEPDHSNPSFCLWTVTVPAQNFETMLKFGAIEFTDIRDNDGSRRGQTADDFLLSWYADPSIINSKEFELSSFKNCLLYYKCRLVPDTELAGQSKTGLAEAQNISIFNPNDYEKDDNSTQNIGDKYGTFTDNRDGHTYKIVRIGNQTWMAENLAYKANSGCWAYDNNSSNISKYGYLYNWQTAKNVCPTGWHLPSKQEFETLLDNYGGSSYNNANYQALIPGGTSGFSALLGGFRDTTGNFDCKGNSGYFWSAAAKGNDSAWGLYVNGSHYKEAHMDSIIKDYGFSVRCVQD